MPHNTHLGNIHRCLLLSPSDIGLCVQVVVVQGTVSGQYLNIHSLGIHVGDAELRCETAFWVYLGLLGATDHHLVPLGVLLQPDGMPIRSRVDGVEQYLRGYVGMDIYASHFSSLTLLWSYPITIQSQNERTTYMAYL